jgi:signal peptidase
VYRQLAVTAGVLLLVVVAAPPPSPLHLSYVTSDSMEPTLQPGDAYLVSTLGAAEEGDVVTFQSPEREGFVTHRVVDVTDEGLITKGDANPSTDQAGGAPPVPRSAVLGEAITVGGLLLVIPGLGGVLSLFGSNALPVAVALVVLGAVGTLLDGAARVPDREVIYVRDVVGPLLLGLAVTVVAVAVLATSVHAVTYPVTEPDAGPEGALTVGEPAERTVEVQVNQPPLTHVVVEASGMSVVDRTVEESMIRTTVAIPAQETTGTFEGTIHVRSYPATLPPALLEGLQDVHPSVAWVASTGTVFGPLVLVYLLLFDSRSTVRLRDLRWLKNFGGRR